MINSNSNSTNTIESELGNSLDIVSGNSCSDCLHSKKEHEDKLGKCYGLDDIGGVWKACNCTRFKRDFAIRAKVYDNSSDKKDSK